MANQETNPFEKLLVDLAQAEIHYMAIGGVACALCGFVRTTEDIDIVVDRNEINLTKLLKTLQQFGEGHARELSVEDFTDEEGAIRIIEEFPVDIFVRLQGYDYQDLLTYRAWHDLTNTQIPYLNAKGLILLKKGSHREKDLIDVSALRRILSDKT